MKKFLSYILTFISLFVISTVVTIQSQSDLLNNQTSSSAGASSPTTLLAGIMESIENNPKLDINGDISISYDDLQIGVSLDADIDLTTLTNPSIMASVGLQLYGNTYQILLTYAKDEIFLSCQNMSIQSKISEITDVVGLVGSLIGQPVAMPSMDLSAISLDSIMEALNNPQKVEVENTTLYTITLPNIAKVTIACDDKFNIQGISIDEFFMIEDCNIGCDIKVRQDANIDIVAPENSGEYLDIASLINGLISYKDKNLKVSANTNIYKNNLIFERIDTMGFAQISQNKYQLNNKIDGVLDGQLNINYLDDVLYAKFNDIGVSLTSENIQYIETLLDNSQVGEVVSETANVIDELISWLLENYNDILQNATIASNQIVVVLPMNGKFGQSQDINVVLKLNNSQIEAISLSGISVGEYSIYTTIYIREFKDYELSTNSQEDLRMSTIMDIVDWIKDVKTLEVDGNLQATINGQITNLDFTAKVDTQNNNQQIATNLFDMPISITHLGEDLYIGVNDIFIKLDAQSLVGVISQYVPQQEIDNMLEKITRIAKNLTINDVLSIVKISTTTNSIRIEADLSQFLGKALKIDVSLAFDKGFVLSINNLEYDDITLTGSATIINSDNLVEVQQADKYVSVENVIDYIDEFISSQNYTISGEIDFSGFGVEQSFDGLIKVDLENLNLQVNGVLNGKIKADVDLLYTDHIFYITYNNQKFALSEEKLIQLLNEFNIDIRPVMDKVNELIQTKNDFSLKSYLYSLSMNSQPTEMTAEAGDLMQTLAISDIIEIIKNTTITNSEISTKLSVMGYDIQAEIQLNESLEIGLILDGEISVNTNLSIFTDKTNYSPNGEYINLDLVTPKIVAIKNTLAHKNFNGKININAGSNLETFVIDYRLSIDDGISINLSTNIKGLNIEIIFVDNELYAKVDNIYLNISLEQLTAIVTNLFGEQIEEVVAQVKDSLDISVDELLEKVYTITTGDAIISDVHTSGITTYITLLDKLQLIMSGVDNLMYLGVSYDDFKISATISYDDSQQINKPQGYLNVIDFVEALNSWVNSSTYVISGELDFSGYGIDEKFVGDIAVDFANLALTIDGKLSGKLNADIELTYANERFYVSYNKQHFTISETELVKLLKEFGIDISNILAQIKEIANIKNNFNLTNLVNSLLGISTLDEETGASIDVDQIVEIVKNITVSSSNIGIDYNFGTFDINANIEFGETLDVTVALALQDIIVNADVTLSKAYNFKELDNSYINLDYVVPRVPQILELIENNNFAGDIILSDGEQNLVVAYALYLDIEAKQFELTLATTVKGLDLDIYISDEEMYLKVENIYLNISIEQLFAIAQSLFGNEIDEIIAQLEETKNISVDDILAKVEEITSSNELVTKLIDIDNTTHLTILDKLTISLAQTDKMIVGLSYNDISLDLSISATNGNSIVTKPTAETYLNIVDFVETLNSWVNSSTYAISGELDFSGYGIDEKFVGDIAVDFANLALTIDGKLSGKLNADIELTYANERFYVSYNKQHFTISETELVELLNEFGIDISNILAQVKEIANIKNNFTLTNLVNSLLGISTLDEETEASIDVDQIVEIISKININSQEIAFNGDILGYSIDLNLSFCAEIDVKFAISNENMTISANAGIDQQVEQDKFDVSDSYYNLDNLSTIANSIINMLEDNQFNGTISIRLGDSELENIIATYDINIVDGKINAELAITYLGQTATIYVIDNQLFINVKGIFVKATIKQVIEILQAELPEDIKQKIDDTKEQLSQNSSDIFKTIEDITNSQFIDKLEITQNKLVIELLGISAEVGVANGKLSNVKVLCTDIDVNLTISSSENGNIISVDESTYIDIDNVYNLVKNVYNYIMSGEYNFNISLSAFGYTVSGYVGYNQEISAHLQTTVLNKTLSVDIIAETFYVNFDGFVAHIAFSDIPALISELNTQFELGISQDVLDIVDKSLVSKDIKIDDLTKLTNSQESVEWSQVLEKIIINLTEQALVVGYDEINAQINLANNMITSAVVGALIDSQNISAIISLCDKQTLTTPSAGLDVSGITDLLKYISKLVKTTNYAGTFSFDYKEDISLDGNYQLLIEEGKISASVSTTFYDLPISLTVIDDVVYAQIDNVKIYLPLAQINNLISWINTSFNQSLPTDLDISTDLNNATGDLSLDGITLGDVVMSLLNNILSVKYQDISVVATIGDILGVALTYKDISATATINTITSPLVAPQGYLPYTDFTNLVDSLLDLYNSGKISATVSASVYEGTDLHYSADCALQIDIKEKLIFISVEVNDLFKNSTTALMVAFRDNYWFVDYNNLKLKINKTDLNEILAILLEVVGIDPSLLPFLSDVVGGLDVNTDSLNAIVPELDFGNPLTLLDVFEKISLKQGELSVEIDNSLIAGDLNSENISAVLKTQNNKLSYISLNNLYTGVTDYETLDLILNMQDFTSVSEPYQGTYIDISGANELIKAVINTAELDYFEITATIDVDMKVIGIPISMSVPMNLRVRLDENRKPEIMISLGDIPVIVGVNNDISGIDYRMWYIYYKDSYIYMLRHDVDNKGVVNNKTVYQKQLKLHVDSFFDDFFYYLQWGVGFSNPIMNEIEKALALTDGYTPDLGKVINGFAVTDSQNFSIDINMGEVANNPQIDNMVVNLGVVNNEETNNKNYIGTAEFYLNMPVATVCTIKLVSEDMKLINIGKSFDFSDFEKFVYNYVGSEGTEYSREWSTSNGTAWDYDGAEWKLVSEREYTITFDSKGGEAVDSITGKTNQEITLPTLSNKVVVDADAGIRYTYKFAGWYETENNQNGTEFTSSTMPKKNVTLYAKWVVISTEQVVTIMFDSNGGTAIDSISGYAGTRVDISGLVPTKATTYVDEGYNWKGSHAGRWTYVYTYYAFDGWYIDSACTTKFDGILPDENTTLYAKWATTTETKYHLKWERP